MNLRKITSLTMVWSLVFLFINSIILYVVPEGRVAYWADWKFLGLTKSHWGAQHVTVGVLFLVAGLLHIYYNWKSIVSYMKNKARHFRFFSGANLIGLVLSVFFVVGTYFNVPPMSTIMNISAYFKDAAAFKYGEPPYGHAELSSLELFAKRMDIDLEESISLLQENDIDVSGKDQKIVEIAKAEGKSPQQIYEIIKPAGNTSSETGDSATAKSVEAFLNGPKTGLGKLTLNQICTNYGLDIEVIRTGLQENNIEATADQKLRKIAEDHNTTPIEVYEIMVKIVSEAM